MGKTELDPRFQIQGKYRHYKGPEYEVIDTVFHSETQELMVLYRALYGQKNLWVRPFDMFNESIQIGDKKVKRFELIK